WTSKPAHRVNTTSILHLHAPKGLAGYPERERLPCVLHFPGGSWRQFVVPAGIQVQFCHRLRGPIRKRPHTPSLWWHSFPVLGQGIEPAYFHGSWCPAGHESSVAKFVFGAKFKNRVSEIQWLTDCQALEKATLRQNHRTAHRLPPRPCCTESVLEREEKRPYG